MRMRKEIQKDIDMLDERANQIWTNKRPLEDELVIAIISELKERKLLQNFSWCMKEDGHLDASLDGKKYGKSQQTLRSLCKLDYHGSYQVMPGVSLRVDDECTSVHFDEEGVMQKFIDEWGITVSTAGISKRIAELEKKIAELKKLLRLIRVK